MKKASKEKTPKAKLTKEEKTAIKTEKKNNKKKMDPILKNSIIFGIIIIAVMALVIVTLALLLKDEVTGGDDTPVQTISALEKYGYALEDRDSDLYKEEFEKLKKNLESKTIDFDAYAESIAKLFVIDLYTISNKVNKYDVGGTEFVKPEARDNFKLKVQDTIYRYVEDNSKGNRNQTLPTVSSVNIINSSKTTYTYKPDDGSGTNVTYDAYSIKYSNEYTVGQGYDTTGDLIIIKDNEFLYIVEKK